MRPAILMAICGLMMLVLLPACSSPAGTASQKTAKATTKKKAPVAQFKPPPPEPKVEQNAFAGVDEALAAVPVLVNSSRDDKGMELIKVEKWLAMQGDAIVPELTQKLQDSEGDLTIRVTVCRVLMKLGKAGVPPLLEATAAEPKQVRVKAIECLGRIKPPTPEIVDKVISLIDDADYDQRKAALGALASLGKPAAKAKDRLQEILNDTNEDETIRSLAKKALKDVDPRKGLMNAY